ncbi:hypothetical protein [Ktedonospora formicarum]|uniref:Uncharacterized protein n=1 Tax=Ktedonospora formicarum TaxID=2778364 RepID=A0A8J3MR94_9CHLR|nr:hypothetical protein [Ktedonospora formicarum]GHO42065.1 hypothetical protein KSX_02280 [Ktedonospora formicarum]
MGQKSYNKAHTKEALALLIYEYIPLGCPTNPHENATRNLLRSYEEQELLLENKKRAPVGWLRRELR